jgi:predicted HTH transcriptional regulator
MDALELIDIIGRGETSTVQFKRLVESGDKMAQELCAFANTQGGTLLVGVEDDGTVVGLDNEAVRATNTLLANVSQDVREPLYPTSEVVPVEGRNVLVVSIAESQGKPHFDLQGAIWVKSLGDKRRVTSREELRRLFQDTHIFFADEQPIDRTSMADLNRDVFAPFLEKHRHLPMPGEGELVQLLENLNVLRDGRMTLAGLLFFGGNPQRYRADLVTKAVAFAGDTETGSSYVDSEDFGGTLPQQFAQSLAFVQRNLHKVQNAQSFNSSGEWEVPRDVFEELLVNALVHRNYFITACPKLFIFNNRIEISSPGTLPNSMTVEQAKLGSSISRNPILQTFASGMMPYRGIGTGIRRAYERYPDIELINDTMANMFRAVIHRPAPR